MLLVRSGKIFLNRRFNTGFMDGYYDVPGGHLDENETVRIGAARECMEEAGVTINPDDLALAHICHRMNPDKHVYVDFFFTTEKWTGEPTNAEPDKSDHADWFPLDGLPEMINPHMGSSITNWHQGRFYSEFGWN